MCSFQLVKQYLPSLQKNMSRAEFTSCFFSGCGCVCGLGSGTAAEWLEQRECTGALRCLKQICLTMCWLVGVWGLFPVGSATLRWEKQVNGSSFAERAAGTIKHSPFIHHSTCQSINRCKNTNTIVSQWFPPAFYLRRSQTSFVSWAVSQSQSPFPFLGFKGSVFGLSLRQMSWTDFRALSPASCWWEVKHHLFPI